MSLGPGCVRGLLCIGIYVGTVGLLRLFFLIDEELRACGKSDFHKKCLLYSTVAGMILSRSIQEFSVKYLISMMILGIYLIVCSITDELMCQVYDCMQYLGVLGAVLFLGHTNPQGTMGFSLILFGCIQYFLFMRMYGKADGMGYCICAMYWTGMGRGMEGYLYHMFLGFLMLVLMQVSGNNVTGGGRLKTPVPLYPYISVSFLVLWSLSC